MEFQAAGVFCAQVLVDLADELGVVGAVSVQPEDRRGTCSPSTPNGELYKIERVWPNCIPLAQAWGEDTEKDHTVIWLNTFGRARVFGTSLGHHNETMNNDVWLNLVAKGLLWSVDRLQPNGEPMAGYEGSGIKPIVIGEKQAAVPVPDPRFTASAR